MVAGCQYISTGDDVIITACIIKRVEFDHVGQRGKIAAQHRRSGLRQPIGAVATRAACSGLVSATA